MHKKKFLKLMSLSFLTLSCMVSLAGCGRETLPPVVEEAPYEMKLTCSSTSIFVGESVTVSVSNPVEGKEYLFVSSDESVLTVSSAGEVTGVKVGEANVTVYQDDDFSVSATLVFKVFEGVSSGETISEMTLDDSGAIKTFRVGDPFSTEGLKVFVDGVEVFDFTTNPAVGSILTAIGENTVYVSYQGCESVAYTITVEPNAEDYSLHDMVARINEATTYTYTIDIDAGVQLDDGTIVSNMVYTYQIGEKAYYLETRADNEQYDLYTYGYVNLENSVMKYRVKDEIVSPICIASKLFSDYKNIGVASSFQGLDPEDMPLRQTGGYFTINDPNALSYLTSSTRTNLSGVYSSLMSLRAYIDEEEDRLDFVLDCGMYGTITLSYSDIGTTTPSYIDAYLEENGGVVTPDSEATRVKELFDLNNLTYSLGTSGGIDVGTAYLAPNYCYNDYSDEFISAYAAANPDAAPLVDFGYLLKDGIVSRFELVSGVITNVTTAVTLPEGVTFQDAVGVYPSSLSMFNENIDMFEPSSITVSGRSVSTKGISQDEIPEEVFTFFGYTSSLYQIPFEAGFIISDNEQDSLAQVLLYCSVAVNITSTQYAGMTYEGFGTVSNEVIEAYIASSTPATDAEGGN